jgi:hypothetical protein
LIKLPAVRSWHPIFGWNVTLDGPKNVLAKFLSIPAAIEHTPKKMFDWESGVLAKSVSVAYFWHPKFEPKSSPRADKNFA